MKTALRIVVCAAVGLLSSQFMVAHVFGQVYGEADQGAPGDAMIQAYLKREAAAMDERIVDDLVPPEAWSAKRKQYLDEYYYMLGLAPLPEKTPLRAVVTSTQKRDGYVVENLHYQSRPGLYVTGNLYRPAEIKAGAKLPAVFYVCGHSGRGRNGNKVAYQSHGIWFARHGYVCLVVDSLQLGEIAATHHGTYRLDRWWWHARGYTTAGVEAWNGIRGIDYLISREDVDAKRIAVTGISGGGAATFWIAAADDRVACAVPVSGMADLDSYVGNRVINGHCDCMFLYNTFRWPWPRIAGLIAPRPLLFVNSDADPIFPMDANERISSRLERLYSHHEASDRFDTMVSVGGHAYRRDIRKAAYQFINAQLKGDAREVTDSEVDIVSEGATPGAYPIPPEELRVFATDAVLPRDELNSRLDEHFVPIAQVKPPPPGDFEKWKERFVAELKRVSFGYLPETVEPAKKLGDVDAKTERVSAEDGVEFRLRFPDAKECPAVLLVVLGDDEADTSPDWIEELKAAGQAVVYCEPRGVGATRWTKKNPPNFVERSHVLLGRTVDAGRVRDVIAAARYVAEKSRLASEESKPTLAVAGRGGAGLIAAYAAVLCDDISSVVLSEPPVTHMDNAAPRLLNVLRVCDVPTALGLIAPRSLTIDADPKKFAETTAIYEAANAREKLLISAEAAVESTSEISLRVDTPATGIAAKYPGDAGIAKDAKVLFVEEFDSKAIDEVARRWDDARHADTMSLAEDVPAASKSKQSLLMTHIGGGKSDGGSLYRRLPKGQEKVYARFYVKFDNDCVPIHHFGTCVGGNNPPSRWPSVKAGIPTAGDKAFWTGVEPFGDAWRWDFYTYWCEMRGSPPRGQTWGNSFVRDDKLKVERDKWICVEMMVKMNDVGDTNGEQAMWIDGKPITHLGKGFPKGKWTYDKFLPNEGGDAIRWDAKRGGPERFAVADGGEPFEGFRWRTAKELDINFLWAYVYITKSPPGHVSKVWFDQIVVATEYIGPIAK